MKVGLSEKLSVHSVDEMARHGEGEDGDHRGRGLHSGPWTLPSVTCIVAVPVSMVPGESWPI